VAYIKHTDEKLKNVDEQKFEIIDYLKRYKENARKLLNCHFPEDSSNCYIKTTFIIWKIAIEKIKQKKHGQLALKILETIAYFGSDNIPTKIFLELVKGNKEKMDSILQLLEQYSMVNLEKEILNIHRLVQGVIRLRLKEQQKEKKTLRKALKLIKTSIEEESIDISRYLPHAMSAWNYASNDQNKLLKNTIFNRLFNRLLKRQIFDENELVEFSELINNKLYNYITYQGGYAFVIGILRDLFNIQERVLGEHPSTLTTRNNMASVLDKQGKYGEALRIYQDVLNIKERVLGEEHPDTLMTKHNMAIVLMRQGKYDEALGIYQGNLKIEEHVLGEEHPDTLKTRNNMALVLDNQGKYD